MPTDPYIHFLLGRGFTIELNQVEATADENRPELLWPGDTMRLDVMHGRTVGEVTGLAVANVVPASKPTQHHGLNALVALAFVPLLLLSACGGGGFDAKSATSDALIAIVSDPTAGNPVHNDEGWEHGVRCDAAAELGKRKVAPAVPALIASLSDPAIDGCVVLPLGEIGDPAAVLPLFEAYTAGVTFNNLHALNSCFSIGPERCLDRDHVLAALGQIGVAGLDQLIPLVDPAEWATLAAACPIPGSSDLEACRGLDRVDLVVSVITSLGDPSLEPVFLRWLKTSGVPADVPATALALMYREDIAHLLPLLGSKGTVGIAYGIIALGEPGTEPALVEALHEFGDVRLAGYYLNCGNDELEAAAEEWASANGYVVGPRWPPKFSVSDSGNGWGSLSDS